MKRAFAAIFLAITFAAGLLSACGQAQKKSESTSGPRASTEKKTPAARRKQKIPIDATHCRLGHKRSTNPNDGSTVTVPILWFVREGSAADFASATLNEFEIVEDYSSMTTPPPPFVIEKGDGFVNTVSGSTITVDFTNAPGQPDQKNFGATLGTYKFTSSSTKELWAQGAVIPAGARSSSGTIAMFLRPEADPCEHSYYLGSGRKCRRVLIEYFDYADAGAIKDLPQTSGLGQNIFPKDHEKCTDTGGPQETSDGDGHEGPP